MTTRREFLRVGAAGVWAMAGLRPGTAAEAEKEKIPVGLQLYSVRGECRKDLPKTIEAVGKMGYGGVEFAGYHGWDRKAGELRKLLDDNGLKCCGTHTGLGSLLGDNLQRTVELHKALGNKFLIVPGGIGGKTKQNWLDAAKRFNEIAEKAKADGMRVGYHNHSHEFRKLDDETAWDIFFGNTKPEVVMQLDTGNCLGGGADPVAILKKFPGRAATVHLKGFRGIVGDDKSDWKAIFDACESVGGTEWYILEQDSSKYPPLECMKLCIENMRKLGK